jgi:N4-gp56 family major capsid protein
MAGPGIFLGVPATVVSLNQQGLLERAFHDGLYPNLAFRAEAMPEEWPANTGQQLYITRPGLLPAITTPLSPGVDPIPQALQFEQWIASLNQFGGTIDTNMPTSTVAMANLFLRNLHQLGLQAGQSINQIARNAMFQAYISGQTVTLTAILSTDTTLRVVSLNGFTDVVIPGSNVPPQPVSTTFPLPITIAGVTSASVVGYIQDNPADANASGTLLLSAQVGTAYATTRNSVKSAYAPNVIRSAAGTSVDAISSSDTFTLQQAINAVAFLRRANVQPHDDGFYHAHISPLINAQLFADPVFQRLNQSLPEHVIYKEGFLGYMAGIMFIMNTESPESFNTGNLVATASSGVYASGIGGEVTNGAGVNIGRVIITGKGAVYEKYLDESAYVTEAGTTGKIGEFDVINNGINILTERIRLIMRSPQDRLQQVVGSTWSISTSFPIPSDITAPSGPQRYKRAVVLECAI